MINVVIPTRGLINVDTLNSVRANGVDMNNIYMGRGDLPDIQNTLTRKALAGGPAYIWFVEDDMIIPEHTLEHMMKLTRSIVAVDYPLDNGNSTIVTHNDEIMWCGLGCTLVNATVLNKIGHPYFSTDHSWLIHEPFRLEKKPYPNKYGGHDINFCLDAREIGYNITKLEGVQAGHMRTESVQRVQTNSGAYEFRALELTKQSEV